MGTERERRAGVAMTAESAELAELRHHWADAYRIEAGPWRAKRRDGRGGWIIRGTVEELWEAIRADYAVRPVRRDVQ
jgi:hypothetical protein